MTRNETKRRYNFRAGKVCAINDYYVSSEFAYQLC